MFHAVLAFGHIIAAKKASSQKNLSRLPGALKFAIKPLSIMLKIMQTAVVILAVCIVYWDYQETPSRAWTSLAYWLTVYLSKVKRYLGLPKVRSIKASGIPRALQDTHNLWRIPATYHHIRFFRADPVSNRTHFLLSLFTDERIIEKNCYGNLLIGPIWSIHRFRDNRKSKTVTRNRLTQQNSTSQIRCFKQ